MSNKLNKKLKIILTDRVRCLGNKGNVKEVAKGYFRNYLQPQKLAVVFSEELFVKLNVVQKTEDNQMMKNMFETLNEQSLYIQREASGKEILYVSVKQADLVKVIYETYNVNVNKSSIVLNEVIKCIGMFKIIISFGELEAQMKVFVGRTIDDAKKMEQSMIVKNGK